MAKYVINRVNQFGCRIQGYEVYDSERGEVYGFTEKSIKKMLDTGDMVYGLALDENGNLVLDEAGFYQTNIMEKTTLTKMLPINGRAVNNTFYTLVDVKGGKYYLVSTHFGHSEVTFEKLGVLAELGMVQGGCKLDPNGGLIMATVFGKSQKKPARHKNEGVAEKKEETEG